MRAGVCGPSGVFKLAWFARVGCIRSDGFRLLKQIQGHLSNFTEFPPCKGSPSHVALDVTRLSIQIASLLFQVSEIERGDFETAYPQHHF